MWNTCLQIHVSFANSYQLSTTNEIFKMSNKVNDFVNFNSTVCYIAIMKQNQIKIINKRIWERKKNISSLTYWFVCKDCYKSINKKGQLMCSMDWKATTNIQ
jgi:hypothetical protein